MWNVSLRYFNVKNVAYSYMYNEDIQPNWFQEHTDIVLFSFSGELESVLCK